MKQVRPTFCEQKKVKNCQKFASPSVCTQCNEKYILVNSTYCEPFPIPAIEGCNKYWDEETCRNCMDGFILQFGICVKGSGIPDCEVFDSQSQDVVCSKCKQDKYVDVSGKVCVKRQNYPISKCVEYTPNLDNCQRCVANHVNTTDKLACLPAIAFCIAYRPSTSLDKELLCMRCESKMLVGASGKECKLGNIEFCDVYTDESNCQSCERLFYYSFAQKMCKPQKPIENCKTMSPNIENECRECNAFVFKFTQTRKCEKFEPKDYCIQFKKDNECQECALNYELSGNLCVPSADSGSKCKTTAGGACQSCVTDYFLGKDLASNALKCFPKPSSIYKNCHTPTNATSFIDQVKRSCNFCNKDFRFYSSKYASICLPTEAVVPVLARELVPSCRLYDAQEGKCLACDDNLVLSTANTCVKQCGTGELLLLYEMADKGDQRVLTRQAVCINSAAEGIPGCAEMIIIQGTKSCIKCDTSDYFTYVEEESGLIVFPSEDFVLLEDGLTQKLVVKCQKNSAVDGTTVQIFGPTDPKNLITNCDLYREFKTNLKSSSVTGTTQ